MKATIALCPCGRPLHYQDPNVQALVEAFIQRLGESITIQIEGRGRYRVSRHYLALHGLNAWEVEILADRGIVERMP